jgi:AcrR family transcriptional regulator
MNLRQEQKLETRRALLEAVYTLAGEGRSFSSLSLREITREAGVVPAAFYRHFPNMEALGLAIVAEVVVALRMLMAGVRASAQRSDVAVQVSVKQFLDYVRANAPAFAFLARERAGGNQAIRWAIAQEERKALGGVGADLRLLPSLSHLPEADLELVADLLVGSVLNLLGEVLELHGHNNRKAMHLAIRAIKQLRLVLVGARHWDPVRGSRDLEAT